MGHIDPKLGNPDVLIAEIAARQWGAITLTQLLAAGLSHTQVRTRLAAGRLHRIHRGVYAVGHRKLSHRGRWMAATLACGPTAVLSHRAAAELWELVQPTTGVIDITVPNGSGRRRKGLKIHRSHLPNSEITTQHGIAVTTPARTLLDLRRVVVPHLYRRALRQAEYMDLDLTGLHTDGTRSEPEAEFLRLCRRHRLPPPAPNRRIGPYTVDFLWSTERLVVEVDAWSSHRGRQAFYDDHQRDLYLRAHGFALLRFTDVQIREEPAAVARLVRAGLLAHASAG
jgi:very-short-patch-repair endonuclease